MAGASTDGWFILPKKIGMVAVIGGFLYLGQTIWSLSEFKTLIRSDIANLKNELKESRLRGDELRGRTSALEGQRVDLMNRLTRLEEGQRIGNDLLREIREDMRRTRP